MKIKKTKKEPKVQKLSSFESICERLNPFVITLRPDEYKVLVS